jgi:lambda family phage tail tape measure protein
MTLRTSVRVDGDARGLRAELERLQRELAEVRKALGQTGRGAEGAARDLDRMERESQQATRATRDLTGAQGGLGSALGTLKNILLGLGVAQLAREIVTVGTAAQSVEARFIGATGSVSGMKSAMAFAAAEADRLGLNLTATEQQLSSLLAATRGTALEDQARDLFSGVAEVGAAMQLSAESIDGVFLAMTQIISKGRVQGEEQLQLAERLPGFLQVAARAMGVTTAELGKLTEAGKLLPEVFLPKVIAQYVEEFGGAVAEAAKAPQAEFNRFNNALTELGRSATSSGFLDGITEAVVGLTAAIKDPEFREAASAVGAALGDGLSFAVENADDLTLALGGLVALQFSRIVGGWATALLASSAATALLTGQITAAGAAAGVFRAALGFLGGPLGIVATIGAGAAAWVLLGDSAEAAAQRTEEAFAEAERAGTDLASAQKAYADAIAETAGKQKTATDSIVADTRRELEIKTKLALFELKRLGSEAGELAPRQREAETLLESARKSRRSFGPTFDPLVAEREEQVLLAEQAQIDADKRIRSLADAIRTAQAALAGSAGTPPPKNKKDDKDEPKGRSKRDIVADLEAELAARRRLVSARAEGEAATRAALVLAEQEQALRRAGLTLADLEGGKNQARAQTIAGLSRQLYEVAEAETAAQEVTRAHAEVFGESFRKQEADLRRWRDETLRALGGAGAGYEALAAQVEDVFQTRLKSAYDADLESRTDWQAGVERGLADVLGEHQTMADLAEEAVTTAFRSMEDAFVELATTGKVTTKDLVDFVLRQLFRMAQQAAVSFATGGDGGVLGKLLGGIVGAIGGAVGGGGGVSLSSSVATVSAPSFGVSGLYHGGGIVGRPAMTRLVDPAVFGAAPRLHTGGLLPGERPAIMLEDERVLTEAQQANTARTLSALAAMAGGGASAGPRVTVNLIGAPEGTEVQQGGSGDDLTLDIILGPIEQGLAQRVGQGRGPLSGAIQGRFGLRPKGAI